jgi:pimeloyl-ACP methyl ester carboxylesterase
VSAVATMAGPAPAEDDAARAALPAETGFVERDGVETYFEVYGTGEETIVIVPSWTIFHSRIWKAQVAYLARHYRVVTMDGRGGGRSGRPDGPDAYATEAVGRDALAVMDATGAERPIILGASRSGQWGLWLASEFPERVRALALACPFFPATWRSAHIRLLTAPWFTTRAQARLPAYPGWLRLNPNYINDNYEEFLRWFVAKAASDPHSSRIHEDLLAYGLETTPQIARDTLIAPQIRSRRELIDRARAVRCPALVIHGTGDRVTPYHQGKLLAKLTNAELVTIPGASHAVMGRFPTRVNLALRSFFERVLSSGR